MRDKKLQCKLHVLRPGWVFMLRILWLGITIMRNAWRIEYRPEDSPRDTGIRIVWLSRNRNPGLCPPVVWEWVKVKN